MLELGSVWRNAQAFGVRSIAGERWREDWEGREKSRAEKRAEARRRRRRTDGPEPTGEGRWVRP